MLVVVLEMLVATLVAAEIVAVCVTMTSKAGIGSSALFRIIWERSRGIAPGWRLVTVNVWILCGRGGVLKNNWLDLVFQDPGLPGGPTTVKLMGGWLSIEKKPVIGS
jgi:hypothetical protein